uniref:Uncharacterized protein n=1 Tax=Archaeoglobus fulgidus TaxID=2234 RepID=A0A7C2SQ05_ARCFL
MRDGEEILVIGRNTKKQPVKDISLKNVNELNFTFYYDGKRHRYCISINYGEAYVYVSEKRGEAIYTFLKFLENFLQKDHAPLEGEENFDTYK